MGFLRAVSPPSWLLLLRHPQVGHQLEEPAANRRGQGMGEQGNAARGQLADGLEQLLGPGVLGRAVVDEEEKEPENRSSPGPRK